MLNTPPFFPFFEGVKSILLRVNSLSIEEIYKGVREVLDLYQSVGERCIRNKEGVEFFRGFSRVSTRCS